jgi:hypothetical protein
VQVPSHKRTRVASNGGESDGCLARFFCAQVASIATQGSASIQSMVSAVAGAETQRCSACTSLPLPCCAAAERVHTTLVFGLERCAHTWALRPSHSTGTPTNQVRCHTRRHVCANRISTPEKDPPEGVGQQRDTILRQVSLQVTRPASRAVAQAIACLHPQPESAHRGTPKCAPDFPFRSLSSSL